jgi:hypothetical protein
MTMNEIRTAVKNGEIFRTTTNKLTNRYHGYEIRTYLTTSDTNPFCYDHKCFDTIEQAKARRDGYKHPEQWHIFRVFVNNYELYNKRTDRVERFAYVIVKID